MHNEKEPMTAKRIAETDLEHILEQTRGLWEEMRGESLFISGATGFFGSWLLESFCHINRVLGLHARATILTRDVGAFTRKLPHLAQDPAITAVQGDVRSFTYPAGKFRYVIHAATEASARQAAEEPLEMLTTMLHGTERMLQFAAASGTAKFLLTSSGAVYGRQPPEMTHVAESYLGGPDPVDAASVYAEGKRTSELMCALYHKQTAMECKIARCWAFCGPHLPLDTHFAIGNFIADVLAGRPIVISGDGTPRRSYLYAADLAIWLWTILFRAEGMVPINVGSSEDLTIAELARTVCSTLGASTEIRIAQPAKAGAAVSRYVPLVERADSLLGLRPTVSLRNSIVRTAAWYGWKGDSI